jgi:hypothetical protein
VAAKHGHLEIVNRLLDHGANINGIVDDMETQDGLERIVFEGDKDSAPPIVAAVCREYCNVQSFVKERGCFEYTRDRR